MVDVKLKKEIYQAFMTYGTPKAADRQWQAKCAAAQAVVEAVEEAMEEVLEGFWEFAEPVHRCIRRCPP